MSACSVLTVQCPVSRGTWRAAEVMRNQLGRSPRTARSHFPKLGETATSAEIIDFLDRGRRGHDRAARQIHS
ncbi:MAG TPA: hypothetical protein VF060_14245 [Trebonia sp.]